MVDSPVSRNISSFIAPSLRNRSPFQFLCLSFSLSHTLFFLFLISFALSHSVEISLPFESLRSSFRVQKVFHMQIIFDIFVGRTVISLSYPFAILKVLSVFILNSVSFAILAFFPFPFAWNTFSIPSLSV